MFFYLAFIASGSLGGLMAISRLIGALENSSRTAEVPEIIRDGNSIKFEFEDFKEKKEINAKRKRLWQLAPVYTAEWGKWLDEQKKLANVTPESPVYLSLHMDGRVRGSGVGYPPWNAFVLQVPGDVVWSF